MNTEIHTFKEFVEDPDKRFKEFFEYNCDVKLNPLFTIDRYLRSGRELIRMANIYFSEQDFIRAFVLYSRYIVLYCQVIKTHPQYSLGDKNEFASINKQLKTIALPRAEKLKIYIKDLFTNESKEYLDDKLNKKKQSNELTNAINQDIQNTNLASISTDYESIKHHYDIENQSNLDELVQKELSTMNSIQAGQITPLVDRSLKPGVKSTSNNNYNLRTINLPSDTTRKFLEIAQANTSRNIETCGILAGKLNQNKFTLSHCIIPKQKGTSDTCSTEHEHELCDIIDSNNLITLGWIHTHPSQTAFLSSIDLHTHFGYQLMIPEAIAIVCAPSFDQTGIFILNPDYGIKEIADCNKVGFHPHTTNPQLFEECDHVVVDSKLKINIIDLRMISIKTY